MLFFSSTRSVLTLSTFSILVRAIAISPAGLSGRSHGGPSWRRANHVHIDLADCKTPTDTAFQTLQMALYFSGEPDDTPRVTIGTFSYAKRPGWAGSGNITGVFPDQGPFTVNIPKTVNDGDLAGTGFNGKGEPWSCSAKFNDSSYKTEDGTICNRAYICVRAKASGQLPIELCSPSFCR